MSNEDWIKNGWNIATKLLYETNPNTITCVSKTPTMVLEDKFIIFYAIDPLSTPKQEYWIIIGEFPPAIIDATNIENECEAIKLFGKIYSHDGRVIQNNEKKEFMLPVSVIENEKNNKELGIYIENIGKYLLEMGETFPWKKYGIKGKIFSINN